MTELRRLVEDPDEDALAIALLRSVEDDQPRPGAALGIATALGVGSAFASTAAGASVVGVSAALDGVGAGLGASGATGGVTAASAATGIATAGAPAGILGASLTGIAVKYLGVGVVAGAFTVGGASLMEAPEAPRDPRPMSTASRASISGDTVAERAATSRQLGRVERDQPEGSPALIEEAPAQPVARVAASGMRALSSDTQRARAPAQPQPVAVPTAAFDLVAIPEGAAAVAASSSTPPPAPLDAPRAAAQAAAQHQRQLAAEVALLDRARAALSAQDPSAALRVLDEYGSKPRTGTLEPETLVLRIRALIGLGDRAGAARLARRFIQRYPESRHVPVLRSVAEQAGESP